MSRAARRAVAAAGGMRGALAPLGRPSAWATAVLVASTAGCAHAAAGPMVYRALLPNANEQDVTASWPPSGPPTYTTPPGEEYCWENVRARHSHGCVPTSLATGRFVQAERPRTCVTATQPAIVGFATGTPVWTCLPGCGPGKEYVTVWHSLLRASDDPGSREHDVTTLGVRCVRTCPAGAHRLSYATTSDEEASSNPSTRIGRYLDCASGPATDPGAEEALAEEQSRQQEAHDRTEKAALDEAEALLDDVERVKPWGDRELAMYEKLHAYIAAVRELDYFDDGSKRALALGERAEALHPRKEEAERLAEARAADCARLNSEQERRPACHAACDDKQRECLARCAGMDRATCTTCPVAARSCHALCGPPIP